MCEIDKDEGEGSEGVLAAMQGFEWWNATSVRWIAGAWRSYGDGKRPSCQLETGNTWS